MVGGQVDRRLVDDVRRRCGSSSGGRSSSRRAGEVRVRHADRPARDELRIWSLQLDREHILLEVVGDVDEDGVDELRHRLDGLTATGARYVLADVSRASGNSSPVRAVLCAASNALARRAGWLRVVGRWPGMARYEASLGDVFAIYRAVRVSAAGGRVG
jgi:hypothetical protein